MELSTLIRYAREQKCSDLHITAGAQIAVRRYGVLTLLDEKPALEESERMILSLMDADGIKKLQEGKDVDVSLTDDSTGRLRVNVYHQRNNLAASIRLLEGEIPSFKDLGMPVNTLQDLCSKRSGLVLVTGPTGSGKSTTLASMIDYINTNTSCHIITIEDPIEYTYQAKNSMVHQRQIGKDVESYATALKSSLREDPDVIMVGEMRDFETIHAALTAAETGHLVFSTLHTRSAAQTIERIIGACPIEIQQQVLIQLASCLEGVISQVLIPRQDGKGRMAGTEIMLKNVAVSSLIRDNKVNQIPSVIQSNLQNGMHSMNHSLQELYMRGIISRDDALRFTDNPQELLKNI